MSRLCKTVAYKNQTENSEYYLAVDGGASKTEFCVYDIATGDEFFFSSGSSNYKNAGTDTEKNLIKKGVNKIFRNMNIKPEQIRGLVMGLSGCDSDEDHIHLLRIIDLAEVPPERVYIGNDCELAFFSEGKPPGLGIVAGTGSISVGIASDFTKARSGGWGSPISDEGSGAWIGISVIKDFLRFYDGYGEYQDFFDIVRKHMGQNNFDKIPGLLSLSPIEEIADFAKLVNNEAENGDKYCASLVRKAAGYIAELADSVYEKLDFGAEQSVDVVMIGSLFKSAYFCNAFKKSLTGSVKKKNLNFCKQEKKPVMGGISLACSMFADTR